MDEADRLAICARVREAREKSGFDQPSFAEMLTPPVSVRTLHNYEHFRPPFKYLRQWAEITGFSYAWLLRGDEAPPLAEATYAVTVEAVSQRLEEVANLVARGFEALGVSLESQPPGEADQRRTEDDV